MKENDLAKRPIWRRLSAVVAIICMFALVGSLLIVLRLAHKAPATSAASPLCSPTGKTLLPPGPTVFHVETGQSGLYVTTNEGVYRYAIAQGHLQLLWSYDMNVCPTATPTATGRTPAFSNPPLLPYISNSAIVANNLAYFEVTEATGSYLYAVHSSNGALVWRAKVNAPNLIAGNLLYTGGLSDPGGYSGDGLVEARTIQNGSVRWSQIYSRVGTDQSEGLGSVGGGNVYVSMANTILAFDALTGKLRWSASIEPGRIIGATRFVDGTLYATASATCYNCEVIPGTSAAYAFNPATGALLWESPQMTGYLSPPSEAGGIVYVGSVDGHIDALHGSSGKLLWQTYIGGEVRAAPVIDGGDVYLSAGQLYDVSGPGIAHPTIIALDSLTGAKKWSFAISDSVASNSLFDDTDPLFASKGSVYTADYAYLYVIHASNGTLAQKIMLPRTSIFYGVDPTLFLAP